MQDMRRSVKERHGLASVASLHAGVVTVVQRFRSDLGLYVHLHCLITDGAFEDHGIDLRFLAASAPTLERMTAVLAHVDDAVGPIDDDLDLDPPLAACVQRSLAGPHFAPVTEPMTRPPRTVPAFGMNLHAAATVDGRDRKQLERLCRYLLRPPFAHDAVKTLPDGRVRILFKQPSRLGVAHVDMDIEKFMARLCALV